MIIETKVFPSGDSVTVLKPEEGYKYITNGEIWSFEVSLGKSGSIDSWWDTNDEPPEPYIPENIDNNISNL